MKRKVKGTHFLFKNTGNGNHWIKIKLVGKKSNRDGFGAKVLVRTSGMTQYQEAGVIEQDALCSEQRAFALRARLSPHCGRD